MDRRTILAFILIALVIFFYDDYIRLFYPPPPATEVEPTAADTVYQQTPPAKRPSDASIAASEPQTHKTSFQPPEGFAISDSTYPVRYVTVETDYLIARLTSDGARLVSLKLKPNGRYLKKKIELIPRKRDARPGFRFWTMDGPVTTEDLSYRLENSYVDGNVEYKLTGQRKQDVTFAAELAEGRVLRVIYTFEGAGNTFLCSVRSEGLENVWVRDYVDVYWQGGLRYTESDSAQDLAYSKAYLYFAGDELEDQKINSKKSEIEGPFTGQTRWGAIRNKYFLAALIPETATATAGWMESELDSGYVGKFHPNRLGVGLRLPLSGSSPNTPIRIYAGPLDDAVLKSVDPSLTQTMSWGWALFVPFSKAILWGLKHLYDMIPNYGICIIIFSVLIKIIIWPLTRKSYQSMSGMQKIQPKIQEIREKYKKDQQKIQKETMKLYKEEGINPMGGCLPILLQMPLLIALFQVFRSTIEFRSTPFIGWITDLSQPDVLFHLPFSIPMYGSHVALLPILMGISTYYQSKTTMTDPNQRMMLYFMPIFMVAIFNNMPSGLTLYYTLFNIWTLIQQRITPPPKAVPAKGGK